MGGFERDVRGFEAELDDVLGQVGDCVERLRSASSEDLRFLIAERLPVLGSAMIPGLEEIVSDPASSRSLRYLAAWVAVSVGGRGDFVDVLCSEVKAGSEWSLPAAGVLACHRAVVSTSATSKASAPASQISFNQWNFSTL